MGCVQDLSDLGGGLACLSGVIRLGGVFPAAEVCRQFGLALDVNVDGPLGHEPLEGCQIGSLPGLVGCLIQFLCESR